MSSGDTAGLVLTLGAVRTPVDFMSSSWPGGGSGSTPLSATSMTRSAFMSTIVTTPSIGRP